MSSKLPVYNTLYFQKYKKDELSAKSQIKLVNGVEEFSRDTKEIVYMIIKEYEANHTRIPIKNIPYGGQQIINGVQFYLEELPIKLKRMLLSFIEVNKISDEANDYEREERPLEVLIQERENIIETTDEED
jgi:hypothetical protein